MARCPSCQKQHPNDVTICDVDGTLLVADDALQAGDVVGEYHIEEKLGQGGFGTVYRAVHPLIGKTVAIKVLNHHASSNPQMVSRFLAEARAVNQIRHRNIIDIFSFGALADGRQYYVMELLEGMTLEQLIRSRGRLEPEVAVPIFRAVARALDAAHAAGIAHRDLKPENIFILSDEDGRMFPKLLDFGIAKLLVDSAGNHKTKTGVPMGTPLYMSPEQCRGKPVDHRTDVYSFGVVVHQTLTGQLPFDSDSVMELMCKHAYDPPPRVSSVCTDLSSELDEPILRMLEKEPSARPSPISAAVESLAQAAQAAGHVVGAASNRTPGADGPVLKAVSTPAELKAITEAKTLVQEASTDGSLDDAPQPSRKRTGLIAVAAVALAIGLGAGLWAQQTSRHTPESSQLLQAATAVVTPSVASEVTAAAPEPTISAVPTSTDGPLEPAEVEVEVQTAVKAAAVFAGEMKLGQAPGPFKLKRSTDKTKLTVRADGYAPQEIDVTPDKNQVVTVSLNKVVVPKSTQGPSRNELEDPF